MEIINCESVGDFFSSEILPKEYLLLIDSSTFEDTGLTQYKPEAPVRRWVRLDGVQKWVIGSGTVNNIDAPISISIDMEGNTTLTHEASSHSILGNLREPFIIGKSMQQSRIDSLSIMVHELEVRLRNLSEDSVRVHDQLREEKLKLIRAKECELDSSRLITILRERVSNRDTEILNLKEDKASLEKRCVEAETSLEISNSELRERESTEIASTLINITWPIRATELRVTAMPRLTICKQDTCVGSYILHVVEETTYTITSDHWFSAEVTENAIKRLLVRWMSGFHPTSSQLGSAVSRQMPVYIFTPKDILELVSRATSSNFYLTGFQTIKECDWAL